MAAMGRLENIVARNRKRQGIRATAGFFWRGLIILAILGMWIFTDWGVPSEPPAQPPGPRERHVDDVRMYRVRKPGDAPRASEPRGSGSAQGQGAASDQPRRD